MRQTRVCEPDRFAPARQMSRSLVVLVGGSLLLAGGLIAVPRALPGLALATVVGGAWLALVLAMTLPPAEERAGHELTRRLGQFRHAVNNVGDEPTRGELQALLTLAHQLGLRDEEIPEELTRIHASISALELRDGFTRGQLPLVDSRDGLPADELCHFAAPVRLGRRRSDQIGHLQLTSERLMFRGARDVNIVWADVTAVERSDRDVVVSHAEDSPRSLRFSCQTLDEAVRSGVIAQHLMQRARREPDGGSASPFEQASL